MFLPPGLDSDVPAPLLVMLHGFGGSGEWHEGYVRLAPIAAARGMLYVHPDGSINAEGARFWNATDACCDVAGTGIDDAAYLAGLIREIGQRVAVDPRRVFVVGHSNGGFMSYRMACDHADLVAGIASLAGASYAERTSCSPSAPVSVLQIHGTLDDIVDPEGGNLADLLGADDDRLADYPSARDTADAWAELDGCTGSPTSQPEALDLDGVVQGASGPNDTTVSAYGGCVPGVGVELWMIDGGDHDPDLSADFGTNVLDFLLAHPKPV